MPLILDVGISFELALKLSFKPKRKSIHKICVTMCLCGFARIMIASSWQLVKVKFVGYEVYMFGMLWPHIEMHSTELPSSLNSIASRSLNSLTSAVTAIMPPVTVSLAMRGTKEDNISRLPIAVNLSTAATVMAWGYGVFLAPWSQTTQTPSASIWIVWQMRPRAIASTRLLGQLYSGLFVERINKTYNHIYVNSMTFDTL